MRSASRALAACGLVSAASFVTLMAACSDGEGEAVDGSDAAPNQADVGSDANAAEASRTRDGSAFDSRTPVSPPTPAAYRAFLRDYLCQRFTPWCSSVYPARSIPAGACETDDTLPPDLRPFEPSLSGSLVEVDLDRVPACLHELDNWMLGGETSLAFNACVAPLRGKLALGATGCKTSLDCAEGFCDSGTCRALKAHGQACADPTGLGDACARLGEVGSDFTCALDEGGTTRSCALTRPLGAGCERDRDCSSGTCTATFTYVGTVLTPGPRVCGVARSPTEPAERCERIRSDLAKDAGADAEGGS